MKYVWQTGRSFRIISLNISVTSNMLIINPNLSNSQWVSHSPQVHPNTHNTTPAYTHNTDRHNKIHPASAVHVTRTYNKDKLPVTEIPTPTSIDKATHPWLNTHVVSHNNWRTGCNLIRLTSANTTKVQNTLDYSRSHNCKWNCRWHTYGLRPTVHSISARTKSSKRLLNKTRKKRVYTNKSNKLVVHRSS